jgi:hypothetical protein
MHGFLQDPVKSFEGSQMTTHEQQYKDPWFSQALMAHACNLSNSGSRDQEDCGLKPARANSSQDIISKTNKKNPSKTRAGGVAQDEGCEFNPST